MKTFLKLFTLLFCVASFAQTKIKGKITDNSSVPLPGANIIVVGTSSGAFSDFEGNYTLDVNQNPPFSIQISYTGFESQTVDVTTNNQTIDVQLAEGNALDEVVVSASRTPDRVFETTMTLDRLGLKTINTTASACFFAGREDF